MAQRSSAEIRSSIEANRAELALSVGRLRSEVEKATDWRAHAERHRTEIVAGAAALGFVVAVKLLRGRRRRRRSQA